MSDPLVGCCPDATHVRVTTADDPDPLALLFLPLVGVFLLGGLLASTEALIVPRLQLSLRLAYAPALSVQLAYYAGFFLFAWPAKSATERFGAIATMGCALGLVATGCLLLAGAQQLLEFPALLGALLFLSSGVTGLQVACNGLASTAGAPARAASRFTLLQAFNSLGTVLGPLAASEPLLGEARGPAASTLFLLLALLFAGLGAVFLTRARHTGMRAVAAGPVVALFRQLLRRPMLRGGMAAVFAYVGAEVTIGSLAVAYLLQRNGWMTPVTAGRLVSLYWGGAMLGRFAGASLLRRHAPGKLLALAARAALILSALAILLPAGAGAAALLSLGLCHSIMFPVIYGLAMPSDRQEMPLAAMLLSMAVVGGAIIPVLTGILADRFSLRPALLLPTTAYWVILRFAKAERAQRGFA